MLIETFNHSTTPGSVQRDGLIYEPFPVETGPNQGSVVFQILLKLFSNASQISFAT